MVKCHACAGKGFKMETGNLPKVCPGCRGTKQVALQVICATCLTHVWDWAKEEPPNYMDLLVPEMFKAAPYPPPVWGAEIATCCPACRGNPFVREIRGGEPVNNLILTNWGVLPRE